MSTKQSPAKAISVWQPWAELIVLGLKPVENRSRHLSHRGALLIQASQKYDLNAWQYLQQLPGWTTGQGGTLRLLEKVAQKRMGGLVGAVMMTDSVTESDSPYFGGPIGWEFEKAIRFTKMIPCRGMQGLFVPTVKPAEIYRETMAAIITSGMAALELAAPGLTGESDHVVIRPADESPRGSHLNA